MRERDALWRAGRAGGVEELGDFGFVESEEVGPLNAPAREELFVGVPASIQSARLPDKRRASGPRAGAKSLS